MKLAVGVLACGLMLSGCLAGNMMHAAAMRGKPLAVVEQRYGPPDSSETVAGGGRYIWNAHDEQQSCALTVDTNAADRVTGVKMVGDNRACYRFRR